MVTGFTYLGSNISVKNRKVSQPESTKQEIATVAYVTYTNLTYTSYRPKCDSLTATSYQYYYVDTKAVESTRMIYTSWMYFKSNVYGGYAIYSGQIRYPMKICTEGQTPNANKLPDQETQNEMVGPYLENAPRSHTKSSTEMDIHRKRVNRLSQDYMEKICHSRTVRYGSDFRGSSSERSRP